MPDASDKIEIENVNVAALYQLEREGLPVYPQPRVIDIIQDKRTQKPAGEYADQLLTANFLIREALKTAGTGKEFDNAALSALSDFWERAMYQAFFFRGAGGGTAGTRPRSTPPPCAWKCGTPTNAGYASKRR